MQIGEGYVICSGTHGKQSFEKALNNSCNCAFAEIADELGKEKLTATAERIGFNNSQLTVSSKIRCQKSRINLLNSNRLDIGWAGIGQYTTLINPCHMLTVVSSIANGGKAVSPSLVSRITTPESKISFTRTVTPLADYFAPDVAAKVDTLLRSNVQNNYGDWRFPGMKMCGKTGTAEISDNPDTKPNGLFVGYSQLDSMPFAIIVVVENTRSSMEYAVPIASKVMKTVKTEYAAGQ